MSKNRKPKTKTKTISATSAAQTTTATMLRDKLLEVFDQLGANKIHANKAKEMSNAAGKIISSVKVQLEYAGLRKEAPNIPFCK